jgi:hypothetical protein
MEISNPSSKFSRAGSYVWLPATPDSWYWSPWFKSWAFVPEKGRVLSPFGYGLYAPQAPHYLPPVFADFRK